MSTVGLEGGGADWSVAATPATKITPNTDGLSNKEKNDTTKILDGNSKGATKYEGKKYDGSELKNKLPDGIFNTTPKKDMEKMNQQIREIIAALPVEDIRKSQGPDRDKALLGFQKTIDKMDDKTLKAMRDYIVKEMANPSNNDDPLLGALAEVVNKELDSRGMTVIDLHPHPLPPGPIISPPIQELRPPSSVDTNKLVNILSAAQWGESRMSLQEARAEVKSELKGASTKDLKDALAKINFQLENGYAKHTVGGLRELESMIEAELNSRAIINKIDINHDPIRPKLMDSVDPNLIDLKPQKERSSVQKAIEELNSHEVKIPKK